MPKRTFGVLLSLALLSTTSIAADKNKSNDGKSGSKPSSSSSSQRRSEPAPKLAPTPKPVESKPAPTPKPAPAPKVVEPKPAPAPKAVEPKPAPAPSPTSPAPKSSSESRSRVQDAFRQANERRNDRDKRSTPLPSISPSPAPSPSPNPDSSFKSANTPKPTKPFPKPGPLPSAPVVGKQGTAAPSTSAPTSPDSNKSKDIPKSPALIAAPSSAEPKQPAAKVEQKTAKQEAGSSSRKERLVQDWLEKRKTPTATSPKPPTSLPGAGNVAASSTPPGSGSSGASGKSGPSKSGDASRDRDHDHDRPKTNNLASDVVSGGAAFRSGNRDRDHDRDHDHDHNRTTIVWNRGVDYHHHHHYCYRDYRPRWSWLFVGAALSSPNYTVIQPAPVTTVNPIFVDPVRPGVAPQPSSGLPRPPRPEVPTPDEFNDLPLEYQRQLLVVALNSLESDLSEDDNGDDWIRHLQLPTLAGLLTEGDEVPDQTTRDRLRGVAGVFDEVAANPDFRPVSELWGFRTLNIGLREYSAEPIVRTRKQLSFAAKEFSNTLAEWKSGDRWVDYLRLPSLAQLDDQPEDPRQRLADLEKLIVKFDRVKSDEAYAVIAKESVFEFTDFALRAYVEELRTVLEPPMPVEPNLNVVPENPTPEKPRLPLPKAPE